MNIEDIRLKAKKKEPESMYELGVLSITGDKGVAVDFDDGYKLLEESAKMGFVKSLAKLGDLHIDDKHNVKNTSAAIGFYEQAAKKKNAEASYKLGQLYFYGKIIRKNLAKAESYFRSAAIDEKAAVVKAQFMMGYIYENGILDGEIDLNEAYRFYKSAADNGDIESQYKVGWYLINGIDDEFEIDKVEGMDYLRKSSERDHLKSTNMLSAIYIEESKKLLKISSKKDVDAKYVYDMLKVVKTSVLI
jgi:TPR repeat protein